ncbi:MAG TPA: glycerate kinase [Segeticoccus sp.]|uniref:glycerate kinase family protein n=1 Tax=Segeticoccus sp. TaxID=2706531 RepID=UPI002D80F212|nr:glycerate kinase [Segeticoccus sp.]HET8600332.1 glycerate kinase [Segeticoccus sp.]
MRVLIAPDSFSGTLTATQAAEAIAAGWREQSPGDQLGVLPLSDGGPGFLDVLLRARGGRTVSVSVSDPLGREVPAAVLVVDDGGRPGEGGRGGGRTAYLEASQACGLHLLAEEERDPSRTTTAGVGQLLEAALAEEPHRIVVGIGGSGTNDGGAGMLAALGAGSRAALDRGGAALADLPDGALGELAAVRERLAGVELVVAADVASPLLGFKGASAVFSERKGASPEQAQQLEAALGRFTEVAGRVLPTRTDLLTGETRRLDRQPGAGAGGGLGYGLLLLGARPVGGVDAVLEAVRFDEVLRGAQLLVTGEGSFDYDSLQATVVSRAAEAALAHAVPTIVLAGQVHVGRRETMALGITGSYAVAEHPDEVAAALADPVGTLTARARRVAGTWSPAG